MGRLENQPLFKTRLPSKYCKVILIEVRNPRAPTALAISIILHCRAFMFPFPALFHYFADRVVVLVFSNQVPKNKLLIISYLRLCQQMPMSTAGNHFPIIGNGNGMGTKKYLLIPTSVSVRYTSEK